MLNEHSSNYLELLKKVLVDYDTINSYEYHPLRIVNPNWKTAALYPLDTLLRKRNFAICKLIFVSENDRREGLDWPARAKTMIGLKRLNNLEHCIREIVKNQVPGDLIETGVWRGGATIFMKAVLKELGITNRLVWLADSFQGIPAPDHEKYAADTGNTLYRNRIFKVSKEEVERNFKKYDLYDDSIRFLKGWFSETLPHAPIHQLSLLRLDGDLYESTILALDSLYHKVSPGGFVIVDDYNAFPYCKQAVTDFRNRNNIQTSLIEIDSEAVYWKKEK